MTSLVSKTTAELQDMYNEAAAKLGEKPVKKFENKIAAVRRVDAILIRLEERAPKEVRVVPSPKAAKAAPEVAASAKPSETAGQSGSTGRSEPKPPKAVPARGSAGGTGASKRGRIMNFNVGAFSQQKDPRPESLRGMVLAALKQGTTLAKLEKMILKDDVLHSRDSSGTVARRAYELVKTTHSKQGYGIKHDLATGMLWATKRGAK